MYSFIYSLHGRRWLWNSMWLGKPLVQIAALFTEIIPLSVACIKKIVPLEGSGRKSKMPLSDFLFSNYPSPRRMMDDGFILKLNHFLFSAHWILSSEDIIFLPRISFSGNICQKRTQSIYQFSRINIIYIIHCDYHGPDFFLFFFFLPFYSCWSTYGRLECDLYYLASKKSVNRHQLATNYFLLLPTKHKNLFNANINNVFCTFLPVTKSPWNAPLLRNVVLKHRIRMSALCEVTNGTDAPIILETALPA